MISRAYRSGPNCWSRFECLNRTPELRKLIVSALSADETAEYIEHHLKFAGAAKPIFSKDAIGALYQTSFGIPRKIGSAAINAMFLAMFSQKRNVDANLVLTANSGGLGSEQKA